MFEWCFRGIGEGLEGDWGGTGGAEKNNYRVDKIILDMPRYYIKSLSIQLTETQIKPKQNEKTYRSRQLEDELHLQRGRRTDQRHHGSP